MPTAPRPPASIFIGIGYSDAIGWTHTDNTIQNTNLYELTLDTLGFYNFGGIPLPLLHRTDTINAEHSEPNEMHILLQEIQAKLKKSIFEAKQKELTML